MAKVNPQVNPGPKLVPKKLVDIWYPELLKAAAETIDRSCFNKGWDQDPKACLGKRWSVGQDHTELLDRDGKQLKAPVPRFTKIELNMLHNSMASCMPKRLGWEKLGPAA